MKGAAIASPFNSKPDNTPTERFRVHDYRCFTSVLSSLLLQNLFNHLQKRPRIPELKLKLRNQHRGQP